MDLNIDADVAFLAGQTPPVKIFPTPNTSDLPYNEQMSLLESEYMKYYSYRGDLKYNENMARSIKKSKTTKVSGEDDTCGYRVCRDKNRFFENRIKDDVLILSKILDLMIVRTSEMEKHLERKLTDAGEKTMPNWDKLFREDDDSDDENTESKDDDLEQPKEEQDVQMEEQKATGAAKRKRKTSKSTGKSSKSKFRKLNTPGPHIMTHSQAQGLVAHMILSRSLRHSKRLHFSSEYLSQIVQISDQEADQIKNIKKEKEVMVTEL